MLVSLGNLMTFPFVPTRSLDGRLELHGAWKDIRDGSLAIYDPADRRLRRPLTGGINLPCSRRLNRE